MSTEISNLINGYKTFYKKYFQDQSQLFNEFLIHGQQPKILFIACCDSRVDPAIVTNSKPGEIFVVRNIANLVPPYQEDGGYHGISAALEFAVQVLSVHHIVIFGHSQCGGIASLFNDQNNIEQKKSFINTWMEIALPAYKKIGKEYSHVSSQEKITLCEQESLCNSLKNLETFPWISEKIKNNTLTTHAWYFDLENGIIKSFNKEKKNFEKL